MGNCDRHLSPQATMHLVCQAISSAGDPKAHTLCTIAGLVRLFRNPRQPHRASRNATTAWRSSRMTGAKAIWRATRKTNGQLLLWEKHAKSRHFCAPNQCGNQQKMVRLLQNPAIRKSPIRRNFRRIAHCWRMKCGCARKTPSQAAGLLIPVIPALQQVAN